MTAWPEVIWGAPELRGLDPRGRGEVAAAGRLAEVSAGDVFVPIGAPADALYVVVEGTIELRSTPRGDVEPAVIRRAARGDLFGEHAVLGPFGTQTLEARAASPATIAVLPFVVLRRALGRLGAAEGGLVAALERTLRRSATADLLRVAAFSRGLDADARAVLLDAAEHRELARGEILYRAGDRATHAYLIAEGLAQAQSTFAGSPRIEAYLARGDLVGEAELALRAPRELTVSAAGPTWLIGFPRAVFLAHAAEGDAARGARVGRLALAASSDGSTRTTAHVFADLYRLRVARSLLVIDQDSCLRCGHCAFACADVHQDGIARLVRRGDKAIVRRGAPEDGVAPLLVPNSCQHCKNPSCMVDCPTGAIGREPGGEVFIRPELCTGCGSCVRACPWDNIQLAPRADGAGADGVPRSAEVAVKCDLCASSASGPACVAVCPTQSIARVDPNAAFVELVPARPIRSPGDSTGASLPPPGASTRATIPRPAADPLASPIRAAPWGLAAALVGVAAAFAPLGKFASGLIGLVLVVALAAYGVWKRSPRWWLGRALRPSEQASGRLGRSAPFGRYLHIAHTSLGLVFVGILGAHVGARPTGHALTLLLAFAASLGAGAALALAGRWLPRRLARLERRVYLPDEIAAREVEIDGAIYTTLSGKSEVVKLVFARVLAPYRRAQWGPLVLALSGRSVRAEERRLRGAIDALFTGHKSDRTGGLDDLVRLVVEGRALAAQRGYLALLRGLPYLHLGASAVALALLAVHVVDVVRR